MGLMDVLNGMQNGPRGQSGPSTGGGGMSPITMALLGLLALPLAVAPVRTILTRNDPPSLVAVLVATSKLEVIVAVLVSVGLCLS